MGFRGYTHNASGPGGVTPRPARLLPATRGRLNGGWGTVVGGAWTAPVTGVVGRYDPFEQGACQRCFAAVHATRADNAIATFHAELRACTRCSLYSKPTSRKPAGTTATLACG